MRTGGWGNAIVGSDWSDLAARYDAAPEAVEPVAAIVRSVAESLRRHELVYASSMWDLIVSIAPADTPPVDAVVVRSQVGMGRVPAGLIRIEHMPLVGIGDAIERDVTEAVPLFWRFLMEKYGVSSGR